MLLKKYVPCTVSILNFYNVNCCIESGLYISNKHKLHKVIVDLV